MVKFPIYITSKGRPENDTAKQLQKEGLDYIIIVNKDEVDDYKKFHKNVVVGDKGHYGAYNSALNRHKDGDFIWVLQDNAGKIKGGYKRAFESLEKMATPETGMLGFRNANFHFKMPKYTKNSMIINAVLHQVVDGIRADPKSLHFLETDLLTQYMLKGYISIRNNDTHLTGSLNTANAFDGGGNTQLYLGQADPNTLTKEQKKQIFLQRTRKQSREARNHMIKKYKLPKEMFKLADNGRYYMDKNYFRILDRVIKMREKNR